MKSYSEEFVPDLLWYGMETEKYHIILGYKAGRNTRRMSKDDIYSWLRKSYKGKEVLIIEEINDK